MTSSWHKFGLATALLLLFFLVGCSKECSVDSDCAANSCEQASCSRGTCRIGIIPGCCGNDLCESSVGENSCTCDDDCRFAKSATGECSGKVKLPDPYRKGKFINATDAEYYCSNDACVIGISPEDVQKKTFFTDHKGMVSFEVSTTLSRPYVLGASECMVQVRLTDLTARATLPVTLTGLQLLSSNELVGEKTFTVTLANVTDSHKENFTLTPALTALEEDKQLGFRLSYEYRDSAGVMQRGSVEAAYGLFPFIDPAFGEFS
jgi:hypothetical protein